jgi:carboxypeptidase Q
MFRKLFVPLLALSFVVTLSARQATEKIDDAMNAKIKSEGMDKSKVMWIEHYLTDVYGPRPIGSPNHVAAANWAVKTLTSWGMKNAHLEPFTWKGIGWMPGRATGFITSPVKANVKFETIPWAPSTKGTVSGQVLYIVPPVAPTEAEMVAFLADIAPKVKGGIVMTGAIPPGGAAPFTLPSRQDDAQAKARYQPDPNNPAPARGGRGGGRGGQPPAPVAEGHLSALQVNARITALVRDNPPALRLVASGNNRIPGTIVAQNGAGQQYDEVNQIGAGVILRNDDFGRIARIIADGTPVTVEFNVQNTYYPEGKTSYVTVGEIPGSDKADEVVMMGGHLDSWASGTGATDNGIGCAIMMEAARILQTVGAHPRRTIRVALWSGEEEGELGSMAYVRNHFGSHEEPKPEFTKLQGYWNIDDGTGLVRGANIFGPPESAAILAQYLKPFEPWGVFGAQPSNQRVEGGTDSGAFAVAGLPGIGTGQDNIEYNTVTWHSNLDNYDRIIPDDVMKNAVISASVMWGLANRDELLPRYADKDFPAIPAGRGAGGGAAGRGGAAAPAGPAPADGHVFAAKKAIALSVPSKHLILFIAPSGDTPVPARTVALVAKPAHGTVVLKADGSFVYTPAATYVGNDSFTYTMTTNGTTTAPGTITIVVK